MTPVGCPEHKHTSSLSQGHGRSSSLRRWTCLPRSLKAWPSLPLPSQKVLSSDSLLVQLQSCAGFAARAVGSVLPFLFPRQEWWIMWSCLALTPGSGQRKPRQLLPNSWVTFKGSSESGKGKSHLLQNTGKLPPLAPCCSHPEAFQEPAEFPTDPALPTEAEWPKKDLRSPMTAPSVPAPAAFHAPFCCRHCAGV